MITIPTNNVMLCLCLVSVKGWHNSAALSYLNPSESHSSQNQSQNQNPNQFSGYNLSYGFAPNIVPCHIPNPNRKSIPSHPIGWAIGGNDGFNSTPQHVSEPVRSQVEVPCQAIRVSEDDMPNFPFKFSSVSRQQNYLQII